MKVTLDDAWTKLRWARKHFDLLRPDIEAFEQRDNHSISHKIDAQEGKYKFDIHGLDSPNPDWGLQLGDCLHNARTALDHLIVRLVAHVTGQEPRDITKGTFPIELNPDNFARPAAEMRKHPNFSGYLTRIEELQPFNIGNPSVWGQTEALIPAALARLSRLDIADKHRIIHAVWAGIQFNLFDAFPDLPDDFKHLTSSVSASPLKNDTEIAEMWFATPLPRGWHPKEVDVKRHFRIQVALDEPLPFKGVLEVVPLCLWGVEAVLTIFDPVFSHGAPPLPVTAVKAPQLAHTPTLP